LFLIMSLIVMRLNVSYCILFMLMRNVKDKSIMWDDTHDYEDFIKGERVLYKDLAKELGVKYTKEIGTRTFWQALGKRYPRYLSRLEEGNIEDETTCRKIIELLKPFTGSQKCFFHYHFLKCKVWTGDDKLFVGNLEDVLSLYTNPSINGSPTYWWAEDKSWCICTDYDLDFILIGATREIINTFLTDDFLECLEVDKSTRVDCKADNNN